MNHIYPLSIPNFGGNERKYVDEALSEGWVSTSGAFVTRFEKQLASFLHIDNIAACQSGTSAIHLSLIQAGIGLGDTVIVTPLTFIAAVNPIRYQCANPIFIDCDDSLCLDPKKVKNFCQNECEFKDGVLINKRSGSKVKAIIVVHVFGNLADMEAIMEIASMYNLIVVEDATEALGSAFLEGKYKGMYAGTIGDFGAFSFNGNKIITTGGGGAVTAKKPEIVDHLRYLSTQAKDDPHYYIHNEIGYNYRMTNLQAALGVAQMEELPHFLEIKKQNYIIYKQMFDGFELAKLLPFRQGTNSNKWFYSLEIERKIIHNSLKEIITLLQEKGIQTRAIWGLINEQKPYLNEQSYQIIQAPFYCTRILNIPSSTQLTCEDVRNVANEIKSVLSNMSLANAKTSD